jgi:hypothetical protein
MIKTYKCIPVVERLYCDDCEVELDECQVLFTYPERYKYMCPKCRKEIITEKMYPVTSYIQFEEVNETTIKAIEEADEMVKNGCGGYDNLDDLLGGEK